MTENSQINNTPAFLKNKAYNESNKDELLMPNQKMRFEGKDIEDILVYAGQRGVKDINIKVGMKIMVTLYEKRWAITRNPLQLFEVIEFIKHLSGESAIGTLNSGVPVDGAITVKNKDNIQEIYRFRINHTKERGLEGASYQITIRYIPMEIPKLSDMLLPKKLEHALLNLNYGIGIVTGATGSGKSTLLAALIAEFLRRPEYHKKIVTAESPVEFMYELIESEHSFASQSQVPEDIVSFAKATENAMRRAPNIILIGESRDKETVKESITSATTGHDVYTTLHTNGFVNTIRRMVDFFPANEQNSITSSLIESIKVVVSQRLIPTVEGKLTALREYVIFDENVKNVLLSGGTDKLTYSSKLVLEKYGHSFVQDAQEKLEAGIISKETYDSILFSQGFVDQENEEQAFKENKDVEILKQIKTLTQNQTVLMEAIAEVLKKQ